MLPTSIASPRAVHTGMTPSFRVSVVIPSYQGCASVRRTLEALARQSMDVTNYEVILSIDGSEDGTQELANALQVPYRLRSLSQPNRGRASACNAGTHLAAGDLVVLLDDDMEPAHDFLLAHWDVHAPGVRRGVVGPAPIRVDSSSPPIVRYRARGMQERLQRLVQPGYTLTFRDVYTGNFSIPRTVLLEVGGLDEAFRLYGHEDYELALRLLKAGVHLSYSPQAVAYQVYDKDFPALARDSMARGHTAVLFAQKHPEVASTLRLGTYHQASPKWRLVRALLLVVSRILPWSPACAIAFMKWLERRRPPRLYHYYTLALDYFFWVGAQAALRQRSGTGRASSAALRTGVTR
jgi:GT2 family glycosyltransferase